jgi:hypothetical protein
MTSSALSVFKDQNIVPHEQTKVVRKFRTCLSNEELEKRDVSIVLPGLDSPVGNKFVFARSIGVKPDDVGNDHWIVPKPIVSSHINDKLPDPLIERVATVRLAVVEEGRTINETSLSEALSFVRCGTKYPSLFVLGNGNIRLVWKFGNDQVGIQFLGSNLAQYVISNDKFGEENYGVIDSAKVQRLVEALGYENVVF